MCSISYIFGIFYLWCPLTWYWYSKFGGWQHGMIRSRNNKLTPRGNALHSHLWRQPCSTWPDFRCWSLFFFIFSVHTRWYWCAWPIGSSRCTDFDLREELLIKSYSCRWTDAILRESTGGGRIWVSVSSRGEGESGLMRRDVSVLPSPPPQSHIKGLRGVMNPHLTFFQYTHYFMCAWAHTHTRRNILYSFRVHIQRPDFCFTVLLMYE